MERAMIHKAAMSSVELLPNEVLTNILSRLTVKDLVRFKCVSNSWKALISDPYFAKKHLKRCTDSESLIFLSPPGLIHKLDRVYLHDDVGQNPNPCRINHLIGSCNGLVCFSNKNDDRVVFLWNPSTRNFRELPAMPIEFRRRCPPHTKSGRRRVIYYGFGHDRISDDYKVIGIVQIFSKQNPTVLLETGARVYSLKTNSWAKKIQDFPKNDQNKLYTLQGGAVSTSNALHWLTTRSYEEDEDNNTGGRLQYVLVAFDLGVDDNKYHEVPQPDYKSEEIGLLTLGVLKGCLCISHCNLDVNNNSSWSDIWIMKEYGVKESWTRLISMSEPDTWTKPCDPMVPLVYSKCGNKVLLHRYLSTELIWYDLTTKRANIVKLTGLRTPFDGQVCLQSLIPVIGGSEVRRNKKRLPTSSINRMRGGRSRAIF